MVQEVFIQIIEILKSSNSIYIENCDLRSKTWIHRGGTCHIYSEPVSIDVLVRVAKICASHNLNYHVVGHTSNLYFHNDYNPDVVISTKKIDSWNVDGNVLHCECGAPIKKVSRFCIEHGLGGFEGFIQLPGTVGGAVVNNSGCFGSRISEILVSCSFLQQDGTVVKLSNEDLHYTHRNSILKSKELKGVILSADFRLNISNSKELSIKAEKIIEKRNSTQEGPAHNLGSTYAVAEYKSFVRILFGIIDRLCSVLNAKNNILYRKKTLLFITCNHKLDNYISDRNIACFIWRDQKADAAFLEYNRFMKRVCKECKLEIEEHSNNI